LEALSSPRVRVVVCAATRTEHDACEEGIAAAGIDPRVATFEMLLTGVGPDRARRALEARLPSIARSSSPSSPSSPSLVVSTGFAGALDRSFARLSWVTAAKVRDVADVDLREGPSEAARCEVVSSKELVATSGASASLEAGVVVDMESAALAEVARARSIPFMVLRLVSDTPDAPLPAFLSPFTNALAAETTSSRLRFAARGLRSALGDPRGVASLLREGREWTTSLRDGWSRFALALSASAPAASPE